MPKTVMDSRKMPLALRKFQEQGVNFLLEHTGALLADEMGLGKTVQAIAALLRLYQAKRLRRAVIVAPAFLVPNWQEELARWAPKVWCETVTGTKVQRLETWHGDATIFLVSYETLRQDIDAIVNRHFDVLILDEAQRVKNIHAQTHKALERIRAYRKWGLTGTPVENGFDEYVAIFQILAPEIVDPDLRLEPWELQARMLRRTLRRKRADQLDLPPLERRIVHLALLPRQRQRYEALFRQAIHECRLQPSLTHQLAWLTKLMQVCNWDPDSGESSKAEYLQNKLKELEGSDAGVLIFSCQPHKSFGFLKERLRWAQPIVITGADDVATRQRLVQRFQNSSRFVVALMSTKASGLGINLTRANYVIHYDHWWTASARDQAEGRAHRLGQRRPVLAWGLCTTATVEEKVLKIVDEKADSVERILTGDGIELPLTKQKQLVKVLEV
jgi:SNF2 family DNA or RNA helicase